MPTDSLSSRNLLFTYPLSVILARGSKQTMSPTSMPRLRVSSADFTSSSSTISSVSKLRFASPYSPFTCTDALQSWQVPSIALPLLVYTRTFSASALLGCIPPMLVMRSLPFAFTSATMPPSVSTCASSSRPSSLPSFTVTSTPPFCVRSAMKPSLSKLSCTHRAARSV